MPGVDRDPPLLELYTRSVFCGGKKKSAQSFCRLRRQTAHGGVRLMERGSKREDEKLSTEAGQVHHPPRRGTFTQ
jgi:hypothetical protein